MKTLDEAKGEIWITCSVKTLLVLKLTLFFGFFQSPSAKTKTSAAGGEKLPDEPGSLQSLHVVFFLAAAILSFMGSLASAAYSP